MKYLIPLLMCLSFGCSSSEAPGSSPKKTVKSKVEKRDPTGILTKEMVASHFGTQVSSLSLAHRKGNAYCTYSWKKVNAEEIDKKNQELIMENLKRKLAGEKVDMKISSSTDQVFFNFYRTFDSASVAAKRFTAMLGNLRKGITVENKGTSHTFKVEYDQEVDGVGDQAAWSSKMNQLSVQMGPHLMHIKVDISENAQDNLEQAKQLMEKIIAKL